MSKAVFKMNPATGRYDVVPDALETDSEGEDLASGTEELSDKEAAELAAIEKDELENHADFIDDEDETTIDDDDSDYIPPPSPLVPDPLEYDSTYTSTSDEPTTQQSVHSDVSSQ